MLHRILATNLITLLAQKKQLASSYSGSQSDERPVRSAEHKPSTGQPYCLAGSEKIVDMEKIQWQMDAMRHIKWKITCDLVERIQRQEIQYAVQKGVKYFDFLQAGDLKKMVSPSKQRNSANLANALARVAMEVNIGIEDFVTPELVEELGVAIIRDIYGGQASTRDNLEWTFITIKLHMHKEIVDDLKQNKDRIEDPIKEEVIRHSLHVLQ